MGYSKSKDLQGKILEVGDRVLLEEIIYEAKTIPSTSFFELAHVFDGRNCTLTSRETLEQLTEYAMEKFLANEKKIADSSISATSEIPEFPKFEVPKTWATYTHSSELNGKILQIGDSVKFPKKDLSYRVVEDKKMGHVLLYKGSIPKFFLGSKTLEELTSRVIEKFKEEERQIAEEAEAKKEAEEILPFFPEPVENFVFTSSNELKGKTLGVKDIVYFPTKETSYEVALNINPKIPYVLKYRDSEFKMVLLGYSLEDLTQNTILKFEEEEHFMAEKAEKEKAKSAKVIVDSSDYFKSKILRVGDVIKFPGIAQTFVFQIDADYNFVLLTEQGLPTKHYFNSSYAVTSVVAEAFKAFEEAIKIAQGFSLNSAPTINLG